ncbi:MAG: thioredoxin-disulfide reductase [Holosporales bacterium]|jgi:thioredoxin reductase (NADPH)|nr:thioredoxin-disulfide reductase [Holosporales bacterium]
MQEQAIENVVIIGSGPAGLTAAIYLARSDLNPLVITGLNPGGQLINTDLIENFPGFSSIKGTDLMMKMMAHAKELGTRFIYEAAESIDVTSVIPQGNNGKFTITIPRADPVCAQAMIIATGARHRHLNIPGESEFTNRGVSWCATCDGPMYKSKKVAVIGGGNSAVMEALFLSSFASEVTLIHRRDTLRADNVMQQKLFNKDNVRCIWNSEPSVIAGKTTVDTLYIKNRLTSDETILKVDGVFIAVGTTPTSEIVKELVVLDDEKYILATDTATSCEGIFAAGDVVSRSLKQAIYAAGHGALAAKRTEEFLGRR